MKLGYPKRVSSMSDFGDKEGVAMCWMCRREDRRQDAGRSNGMAAKEW